MVLRAGHWMHKDLDSALLPAISGRDIYAEVPLGYSYWHHLQRLLYAFILLGSSLPLQSHRRILVVIQSEMGHERAQVQVCARERFTPFFRRFQRDWRRLLDAFTDLAHPKPPDVTKAKGRFVLLVRFRIPVRNPLLMARNHG